MVKKKKKKSGFDVSMADTEPEAEADATDTATPDATTTTAPDTPVGNDDVVLVKKKKKKKKIDLAVLTGEDGGGPPTLVIAEVLVCAPHPMAEKLTICTVDYGGPETARVVCGAPNVKAGLKVIFATVGAIIPSTGEKLVKTPLRGVMSEGMLLSAAEMGWMASAVGIIECPKRAPIGDPAPMDPPPDLAMADPAAKKNKSSKDSKKDKKDKKDKEDRPESPAPISDSSAPMDVAEIDAAVLLGAKKKKMLALKSGMRRPE